MINLSLDEYEFFTTVDHDRPDGKGWKLVEWRPVENHNLIYDVFLWARLKEGVPRMDPETWRDGPEEKTRESQKVGR